jgi:hypothetical protein
MLNRFLNILVLVLILGCVSEEQKEVISEEEINYPPPTDGLVDSMALGDCGISPYTMFDNSVYGDTTKFYKVKLRFLEMAVSTDSTEVDSFLVESAINELNGIYSKFSRYCFVADDLVKVRNDRYYEQGITYYAAHAGAEEEVGYLNVLMYDNSLSKFSGAAVAIPSISIAVQKYYVTSSTLAHEIGHALFALYHPHTRIKPDEDRMSYKTGDLSCDTPYADHFSITFNMGHLGLVSDSCDFVGELGSLTKADHDILVRNLMAYSIPECRTKLTTDQLDRGAFSIANSKNHERAIEIINEEEFYSIVN